MTPEEPAPRPAPGDPTLEDLLVGALDCLERRGPAGLAEFLARHPAASARLHRHLSHLHDIGFVDGAPGAAAAPPDEAPRPHESTGEPGRD